MHDELQLPVGKGVGVSRGLAKVTAAIVRFRRACNIELMAVS